MNESAILEAIFLLFQGKDDPFIRAVTIDGSGDDQEVIIESVTGKLFLVKVTDIS